MADAPQTDEVLVIRTGDGGYYGIPWTVVEDGRIPPEEVPDLEASGDVHGFRGGVLLPYAEAGTAYALPPDVLERYRLPADQAAAVDATLSDDVAGYSQGQGNAFGHSGIHGGGPPLSIFGNVTIINQYNTQIGYNIAFGSPGAVLSVANLGLNTASA
jgi:hypothetical protein